MLRDVFYIGGYDPRSYRYYYMLLKKNLLKQNAINNLNLEISSCINKAQTPFCKITHQQSLSYYYFLEWNAIVKKYWSKNLLDFILDFIYFLKMYILSGIFVTFIKESKVQLVAGLYPIFYFIFGYSIAFVLAYFVFLTLKEWNLFVGIFIVIVMIFVCSKLIIYGGKKIAVFWLSNIYVFCAKYALNKIDEMGYLNESFAKVIYEKFKEHQNIRDYELILSAHSVGTILAVNVVAKVITMANQEGISLEKFKLLTLGECIPLVSFQKNYQAFREDLELLVNTPIVWFDITSAIDGACFPLVDFIKIAKIEAKFPPIYLPARFHKLFTPQSYKKIRKNRYLAHFLYLYATEIIGVYDYFNFIGGADTLEAKLLRSKNE
ncbi:hypothetical protein LS72_004765 [Helicobacter apodemus]|uniref:DUF829 domain-containing protein n=1 Tax=Helicobacter apodemus TaxID=135569 RepID=A0A4U8UEV3_9HELI|nr:hypothetical protein [Helicobacter apodemus]TLE16040.1 hypothetical protein LS72_004765 [Helicobacter apodemus]